MKARLNAVYTSSILFTIALLCIWPVAWTKVLSAHSRFLLDNPDVWFRESVRVEGDLGIASLTIIVVGLIVTWTAYLKASRWAWLVMFVIVWGWAFPLIAYPILGHRAITVSEWVYGAIHQSGLLRAAAESVLVFALMVIALLLPIRSFFFPRKPGTPGLSPRFIIASLVVVVVGMAAFLVYAHLRIYEIPDPTHFLTEPPPPPPPGWHEP